MKGVAIWTLRLDRMELVRMEREQLEMIWDGLWLIEQALKGRTDGPLTLPNTGLAVRT